MTFLLHITFMLYNTATTNEYEIIIITCNYNLLHVI